METTVKHSALGTKITDQPAIYVGTYHKYNSGSIAGAWVDMTEISDREDFENLCRELHSDEDDPEFMFQDWQNIAESLISESGLSDEYWGMHEALGTLSADEHEAYQTFVKYTGNVSEEDFRDAYQGKFASDEDFVEDLADQLGLIPENQPWPLGYIDWKRAARDLMMDYFEQDGYYFRA